MHLIHTNNNLIMLDSERLDISEWEKILVNIFMIILFVFVNPFYALIICGFLNLMSNKINYWIFSCMFSLSFALAYLLQDYSLANWPNNSDIVYYITSFQTINELSWSEIFSRFISFPNGNELFYWGYVKILNFFFLGNGKIYLLFHYFIIFFLVAYLGKVVDTNKFVIVTICILLLNFVIFLGITAFRQTYAFLIFFIGVFSFDANERKWFPRILIYSSCLFHITLVPIIIFFEFFAVVAKGSYKFEFRKLYSKGMVLYMTLALLAFIFVNQDFLLFITRPFGLAENLIKYYRISEIVRIPYSGALFNWFTYLILLSLWLKRKKLSNMHVFVATQYFIFIFLLRELDLPGVFERYNYYLRIGGAIIIGYLGAFNFRYGFVLMMIVCLCHAQYFYLNYPLDLSRRMFSEFMNPVYGLGRMILNYDTLFNYDF